VRPSVNSPASVAYHGDRLTAARMLEVMDDSIDCPFMDDYSPDEQARRWTRCRARSLWPGPSSTDSFRPRRTAILHANACPALRGCSCPGVGHLPMVDDPDLVVRTIMAVTGVAA
jgi:pimeloyl-ACP methyl ester carboxylesterase